MVQSGRGSRKEGCNSSVRVTDSVIGDASSKVGRMRLRQTGRKEERSQKAEHRLAHLLRGPGEELV